MMALITSGYGESGSEAAHHRRGLSEGGGGLAARDGGLEFDVEAFVELRHEPVASGVSWDTYNPPLTTSPNNTPAVQNHG